MCCCRCRWARSGSACFIWQLRGRAILPIHDPQFDEALGDIIERGGEQPKDGSLNMANMPPSNVAHDRLLRSWRPSRDERRQRRGVLAFGARADDRRRSSFSCSSGCCSGTSRAASPAGSAGISARRRTAEPAAAGAAAADQPEAGPRRSAPQRRRHLNTYGWVDKNAGVVRIPIGEAMKLTIERGLPARQTEKR